MNKWVKRLYDRSPALVQDCMITTYGFHLKRLRQGGNFEKYVEELEKTQHFPKADLIALQEEKLSKLIRHCYDNVPYYTTLFQKLKLKPDDFRSSADLQKLPVLSKQTVRSTPELFHARNYAKRPFEVINTSGTTGTTLRIRIDAEGRRQNFAFFQRLKNWAGIPAAARSATFAGRAIVAADNDTPPFWRFNLASNNLLLSSYHLSWPNLGYYVEELCKWDPVLIDSYPSSVYLMAKFITQEGCNAPHPRAIITSSETLHAGTREIIERAFRTQIFDQYGSAEQACFISQCEKGSYHVHPEFGITEFHQEGSGQDRRAKIIATGFTNMAMPFLRYETGDFAVEAASTCDCGKQFPIVEELLGREDDFVITPDGRSVGRLDPVFKGLSNIRRAQIVQEDRARILIKLVSAGDLSDANRLSIQDELEQRLGSGFQYSFEMVDDIEVGPGGKFRSVISRVKTGGPHNFV